MIATVQYVDHSHINLYPYSILSISPEGLDAQMSLHPFEEGLYDPSVFIKKGNVPGLQKKVVRIVSEGSFEFRFIIYNSSDFEGIVFRVSPRCEPHCIISEDIICVLQKVFSGYDFKLWSLFFPYNEERVEQSDMCTACPNPSNHGQKYSRQTAHNLSSPSHSHHEQQPL